MAKLLSFLVKNVCQIITKPITFQQNLLRKFPQNQLSFTDCFSAKFASKPLQICCNIGRFFFEFVSENPAI